MTRQKSVILMIVIGLVVLSAGFAWWQYSNSAANKKDGNAKQQADDESSPYMTKEEKYQFENVRRVDGVIESVSGDELTVRLSDGKTANFQLLDQTEFSRGEQTIPSDRSSLGSGQKIVLSYDTSNQKLKTVWTEYDVEVEE